MPARLKFLKSQAGEVAQVREWIERLALTHAEVGFSLWSEERRLLNLRPQSRAERVRAILALGEDYPLIEAPLEGDYTGTLYWLQGLSQPNTRRLVQIVNGRALRDRLLQQALLGPFKQALLPGQFPALALYLEVPPASLDVNVHPTKTEVRFLDSGQIFRALVKTAEHMVGVHGAPAFAAGLSTHLGAAENVARVEQRFAWSQAPTSLNLSGGSSSPLSSATPPSEWRFRPGPELFAAPAEGASIPRAEHPFAPDRYVGALFQTYLLYDLGEELALIDQHAAHERIRYEKLKARALSRTMGASQALLLPEAAPFDPERIRDVEARLPWLAQLGFEAEIFGESSVLFRTIPTEWGIQDLRVRLRALLDRLLEAEEAPTQLDEKLFEKLASEACHSAVRAGDRLEPVHARALVEQLFTLQHPWNCPHGRPTVVRIPRGRFEEWFQRRV
jgi:DNA mismatch repair protein MutL